MSPAEEEADSVHGCHDDGCFMSPPVGETVAVAPALPMLISHFRAACQSPSFLAQWTSLGPSFHPNELLVAGNPCYDKFCSADLPLKASLGVVFHGTPVANMPSILKDGLDPDKRKKQTYGPGEYFSKDPTICLEFARKGMELLVFVVVLLPERNPTNRRIHPDDIVVVNNNQHQLPIGTVKFESRTNVLQVMNALERLRKEGKAIHTTYQRLVEQREQFQKQRQTKIQELSEMVQEQTESDPAWQKLQRLQQLHTARKAVEDAMILEAMIEKQNTYTARKKHRRNLKTPEVLVDHLTMEVATNRFLRTALILTCMQFYLHNNREAIVG